MAHAPLVLYPNALLLAPSERVTDFGDLGELIRTLTDTLYAHAGAGIAGVQIGVSRRIILTRTDAVRVFCNPEVIAASKTTNTHKEGCLSIPHAYAEVTRPEKILIRYDDVFGETREEEADGFLATVLQHEIDHTNGVLFISYLSRLKRERLLKKAAKS